MATLRLRPGQIRDTIANYLKKRGSPVRVLDIRKHVESVLGPVSPSSVQSSLNLQSMFRRVRKGFYIYDKSEE